MAIQAVEVSNFRGLRDPQTIKLRPITVFIGPNSSGKSSCIHALALLSQTLKLPNTSRPLSPDDEFAYVHLGRFIEVIHSKSYSDSITLGFHTGPVEFQFRGELKDVKGICRAVYEFRCTKRTQDIYLDKARIEVGDLVFEARKQKNSQEFIVNRSGITDHWKMNLKSGFLLNPAFGFGGKKERKDVDNFINFIPLEMIQGAIQMELQRTLYLGPFRQSPLRRYPTRGASPKEVGAQGEHTITLLANETVQSRSREHIVQIARWLHTLGLATKLDVSRVGKSDLFGVNMSLHDGAEFPIADLGYGLSQVLPVLTQCSFAPLGSTLLFEQPEIHLHALAARPLAKVFIDTARTKRAHILIETHSPELFSQFIREMRDGNLKREDFIAYSVRRNEKKTCLKEIADIDPETFDVYDRWEAGLCSAV